MAVVSRHLAKAEGLKVGLKDRESHSAQRAARGSLCRTSFQPSAAEFCYKQKVSTMSAEAIGSWS